MDGTPILDVKPYTPAFDSVENPRIPEWCKRVYEVEDYF
jgi:tRNA (Thr-GGU) A37 N-methylase